MQINTKYSLGDSVWYMDKNKALQSTIVNLVFETGYKVKSNLNKDANVIYTLSNNDIKNEVDLFPSKEELIKSL